MLNGRFEWKLRLNKHFRTDTNYEPGFTSGLMLKDLRLSQDAAQSADCWTPMGARATELYEEFVESGASKFDFSAIIRMIEKSQ